MHHRASRPLLDLPHCLSRATARRIGTAVHSRSGRLLLAVSAVLSLGPAGYAALGPVAPRIAHRHVSAATGGISGASRDEEVLTTIAREGDREADLLGAGPVASTGPSASPTPSNLPTAGDPLPVATASTPAKPAPRPRPSHSPSSAPKPRPRHSPRPAPTETSARRDTTTPNTRVVVRFATRTGATLLLSADEPASFACSLDAAAYTPCSSPVTFTHLASGWHTVAVRAIDVAGNADPTPAQVRWHARGGH